VPQLLTCLGVERGHHLGCIAPGKDVDDVGEDKGCRVALADVDLPPACQRFGPRCRLREGAGRAFAIQPALLWIAVGRALRCGRAGTPKQHGAADPQPALRRSLSNSVAPHVGDHVGLVLIRYEIGSRRITLAR